MEALLDSIVSAANERETDGTALARLMRGRPLRTREGAAIQGLEDATWETVSGLTSRVLLAIGRPPAALVKWAPTEDETRPWSYAVRVADRAPFEWRRAPSDIHTQS